MARPVLVITADDFGYARCYDAGIAEAVRAQAVDAVGVMVGRDPDPHRVGDADIDLGLHLELDHRVGVRSGRAAALGALEQQLGRFRALFGREPDYLDGHKHCHAAAGLATTLGRLAAARGLAVRSVNPAHRRTLRGIGARTPDLLVGRLSEGEPPLPAEVEEMLAGRRRRRGRGGGAGVCEWMTHPGHPGGPSSYDAGRGEDLDLLLELGDRGRWRARGVRRERISRALAIRS